MTLPVGGLKITKSPCSSSKVLDVQQPKGVFRWRLVPIAAAASTPVPHTSLAASKPMANISRLLPAALLLRVHGPATTIRVHTHGQGRPRSPIRQRQCNYNCLRPALFYSIVYYIVLHTTIWTDTAPLSSTKPSVWRRTPVCADNAAGGCRLLDAGKRWNCV